MHAVRTIDTLCLHKEMWPPLLNIAASRLESAPIEGHDTFLAPLAPKSQRSLGPTNRLHVERRELRDSRAGGIEQLEHRRITQPRRRRGVGGLEQRLDLPGRQHTRKIARQFGRGYRRDRIALNDSLGSHPPIERAYGRQMRRKGPSRHLATRQLGQIGANGPYVGEASVDALVVAPRGEALEARGVGGYRIGGESFDACNVGNERVDGTIQVKDYDLSPPNRSERVSR